MSKTIKALTYNIKYDKEFKQTAVELSYARGNATDIADELGIDKGLLYRWRKELKKHEGNSFPVRGAPKLADLEQEVVRLRKELRDEKMVNGFA